jgi:hypothetical protein
MGASRVEPRTVSTEMRLDSVEVDSPRVLALIRSYPFIAP